MNNFIDIIAAPNQVFERLKQKPSWFIPWLVIALLAVTVQLGFYNLIDPGYLLDQLVEQRMDSGIPESELRNAMQGITENTTPLIVSSSVAVFVGLLLIYAISAVYLFLVSKFSDTSITYRQWLSMVSWCNVPAIFTVLAAWLAILSSGRLIEIEAMNPLNLNYLLFQSEGDFAGMLSAINLVTIWSVLLMIMGHRIFTASTYLKSATVVLTPYVLILLVWTLIILR